MAAPRGAAPLLAVRASAGIASRRSLASFAAFRAVHLRKSAVDAMKFA